MYKDEASFNISTAEGGVYSHAGNWLIKGISMSNYEEIATRIADIIISPDSVLGFVHGALSVPVDLGYMAYGVFDTDSHYAHETQTIRIIHAIKNRILNYDRILDAIKTVFEKFDKYVSESKQNKIYSRSLFSIIGRTATNSVISAKIATAIAQRAGLAVTVRGGLVGNLLLIGGMKERCIRTSEALSIDEPEIYGELRKKDYDLLYFMFEPALKPFVDALIVRRQQGMLAFDNILERVESKLSGSHGVN